MSPAGKRPDNGSCVLYSTALSTVAAWKGSASVSLVGVCGLLLGASCTSYDQRLLDLARAEKSTATNMERDSGTASVAEGIHDGAVSDGAVSVGGSGGTAGEGGQAGAAEEAAGAPSEVGGTSGDSGAPDPPLSSVETDASTPMATGGDSGAGGDEPIDAGPTPTPALPAACLGGPGGGLTIGDYCVTQAAADCRITDFTTGSYDEATGEWGYGTGLGGTTFLYQGSGTALSLTQGPSGLSVTGSVLSYSGIGLSFDSCTDASAFEGLAFTLSGTVGAGARLVVQLQTEANHPINMTEERGACPYSTEQNKWVECGNNALRLAEFDVVAESTLYLPWTSFRGGLPDAELRAEQLRGVQLQVECDTGRAPCVVDMSIRDMLFYRGHAPDETLP